MLTETHGRDATRKHVIVYTLLLVPVAIGLGFTSIGGPFYMAVAVFFNAWFLKGAYDIYKRDDAACEADKHKVEIGVFKVSLYYLFAHFVALLVEAVLRVSGIGGW
jgi:protoheme IX farnesyltransferase